MECGWQSGLAIVVKEEGGVRYRWLTWEGQVPGFAAPVMFQSRTTRVSTAVVRRSDDGGAGCPGGTRCTL